MRSAAAGPHVDAKSNYFGRLYSAVSSGFEKTVFDFFASTTSGEGDIVSIIVNEREVFSASFI